jgi:outer membrane protein assembly factor BamD (BamD/ComL family)
MILTHSTTKKVINIFVLGFIISLLISCTATKQYEKAVSSNSIYEYELYQNKFPKSKYKEDINRRLHILYDDRAWENAKFISTIDGFNNYLRNFPAGKYVKEANEKVEKIEKQKEIDNAWSKTKIENTIEGYQKFIDLYPGSMYLNDAKSKLIALKEENAWTIASANNSIESYSEYLKNYPYGKYAQTANSKIITLREEKIILPVWNDTKKKNTYWAYSDFLTKYPNSSYAKEAKEYIQKIEQQDWDKACKNNSVKSYTDYIKKYPFGAFVGQADKRIIDLEVDKIFSGDYGQLPAMSRNSFGYSSSEINTIQIYNNTQYTLTIRYSGVESKKILLSPKQRTTTFLKNGSYRIAASVNASDVRNYAGIESLTGGDYSSEYYIQTQSYWK